MTPGDAIGRWRLLTPEQVEEEKTNNPKFRLALDEAVEHAMKSSDSCARFWSHDAAGMHQKQYNVALPPAPPKLNDKPEPDWTERERRRKPLAGTAFPS
jgi:hypothetical protein